MDTQSLIAALTDRQKELKLQIQNLQIKYAELDQQIKDANECAQQARVKHWNPQANDCFVIAHLDSWTSTFEIFIVDNVDPDGGWMNGTRITYKYMEHSNHLSVQHDYIYFTALKFFEDTCAVHKVALDDVKAELNKLLFLSVDYHDYSSYVDSLFAKSICKIS